MKDSEPVLFSRITKIPYKGLDKEIILDSLGKARFSITYFFDTGTCALGISSATPYKVINELEKALPGFKMEGIEDLFKVQRRFTIATGYRVSDEETPFLENTFVNDTGSLSVIFNPVSGDKISAERSSMERSLSSKKTGETLSLNSGMLGKQSFGSYHTENFDESSDILLMKSILDSINRSIARNGMCYKIAFAIEGDDTAKIFDYLNARVAIMSKCEITAKRFPIDAPELFGSVVAGRDFAARLLNPHGGINLSYSAKTHIPGYVHGVEVGTYLDDGVSETDRAVFIDPSVLNLGFIISGLPGSGKTKECMAIIDALLKDKPMIVVISPTSEWAEFAGSHGLKLVRLCDGATPINFFNCPMPASRSKFAEDLSMLIASASNSGPYRSPMEKCILNAFKKVYDSDKPPSPADAYNAIERSIIEFHAKESRGSVRYTKHGENIRSALENLRKIIAVPEYSASDGIDMAEAVKNGVVFDMSLVSNSSKPYLSALVLNQVYSIASSLSMDAESKLKLLICIEESQILFKDSYSAAVQDIRLRIQDFRKQGIGLILMAHNINDIDQGIRRLCQNKIYLKQAPDVARIAAKDLLFTYMDEDQVEQKLKHLNSRVGAFSSVIREGGDKITEDTVFIRTKDYK